MKICRICGDEKQLHEFEKRSDTGKYRGECKCCGNILRANRRKAWTPEKRSEVNERKRKWYDAVPGRRDIQRERSREISRKLRENPEYRERDRQWKVSRRKNPDYLEKERAYHRENKKEKRKLDAYKKYMSDYLRDYRIGNKDKLRRLMRDWVKNNHDRYRISQHKHRALRKNSEGSYSLSEWTELCDKYDNKCLRCKKKIKLTVDHVIPLVKGGSNYIENIQPLCRSCNSSKKDKCDDYRY